MSDGPMATSTSAELRREFDESFSRPVLGNAEPLEDLIGFRIGHGAFFMRLREIDGITPAGRVVGLPSRAKALVGVTNIRGSMVPTYSLAVLLGLVPAGEPVRWLAVVGGREPLALALGAFDAHLRVRAGDIHASQDRRSHVHQFARITGVVREIVDVASVVGAIRKTAAPAMAAGN